MLDDPRVNFAISTRGREPGLDHLGIQVETDEELPEVYARLRQAGGAVLEEGKTTCCYAKSEKSWIDDPAGISWETFHHHRRGHDLRQPASRRTRRSPTRAVLRTGPSAPPTDSFSLLSSLRA